jgi:pimeloyl-ACP methyl ester carboxylesterase
MSDEILERVLSDVPQSQREKILQFRQTHIPKSITVEGFTWEYIDCGAGEQTLVMVPGGLRHPGIGWKLLEQLEKEYRIIAPSYPTTGSIGALARGVLSILDHKQIDRFTIIGSSYGGIVLQAILQMAPQRVSHAIIANTGTISENPNVVRLLKRRLSLIRLLPGRLVIWIAKKGFKRMLAGIEEDQKAVYEALVEEPFARGWFTKRELVCHFEGLIDFQLNHQFTPEDTSQWDTKVLIIKSSNDPGVLEGASEALDRMYPKAETHVFEEEGHMPSITRTDEYLKLLHEFLKE